MADKKISALTGATTPLAGTEVLPIVQGSATVKVSVANLTAGRAVSASQLDVDNIRVDGNTISSTNTNGNVVIDPNGSGFVEVVGNGGTGVLANALSVTIPDTIGQRGSFRFQNASGGSLGGIAVEVISAGVYPNAIGKIDVVVQNGGSSVQPMSFGVADATLNIGNLVIGTSGKGIDFSVTTEGSGTMTSELLADYEEGTFTPTIVGTTTAGSGTYNSQLGRYTRIGRVVTFQLYVDWSAHTGTGNMEIEGLPFTSNITGDLYSAVAIRANNVTLTAGNYIQGFILNNSTRVRVGQYPTGGGANTAIALDTAGSFVVSSQYIV